MLYLNDNNIMADFLYTLGAVLMGGFATAVYATLACALVLLVVAPISYLWTTGIDNDTHEPGETMF